MITRELTYESGQVSAQSYVAYHESTQQKPVVLIVHDWTGRNEFVEEKARQVADLGYVGFAVDMYGNKQNGKTNEEKAALMMPLVENRQELAVRMNAAVAEARQLSAVNPHKVAAMGYCFGGLCALDLARSGTDVNGVISLHGALGAPDKQAVQIKSKVLVLHGYADPMVPPAHLAAFADEMTEAGVDWQTHCYGHTYHAFTNPEANDKAFGTVYSEQASKRSWQACENFLSECFS